MHKSRSVGISIQKLAQMLSLKFRYLSAYRTLDSIGIVRIYFFLLSCIVYWFISLVYIFLLNPASLTAVISKNYLSYNTGMMPVCYRSYISFYYSLFNHVDEKKVTNKHISINKEVYPFIKFCNC